jgi:hypothetical protein
VDIVSPGFRAYIGAMKRFFDMDDRARLPWRFHGLSHSLLALG